MELFLEHKLQTALYTKVFLPASKQMQGTVTIKQHHIN